MKNKDEMILELYENFADEIYIMSDSKYEISQKISMIEQKLNAILTKEQKQLLDELNTYQNEKNELVYKNNFSFGFKLANRLLIESLIDDNKIFENIKKHKQ